MIIILKAYATSEWHCPMGVLELDPETVEHIIETAERAQAFIGDSEEISCVCFWDSCVEWYECQDLDELLGIEEEPSAQGEFEDKEFVVLETNPFDNIDPDRTEVDQLTVTNNSFYWESILKHTNVRFDTRSMTLDDFKEITSSLRAPKFNEGQMRIL